MSFPYLVIVFLLASFDIFLDGGDENFLYDPVNGFDSTASSLDTTFMSLG